MRVPNNKSIAGRNFAGSTDIPIVMIDINDQVVIGSTNINAYVYGYINTGKGLMASGDGGTGFASTVVIGNTTNTTVTNDYVVAGGQAATTHNTGWLKVYIGTAVAWIPYWANATP